jgi:uncharacterized repeat protein (TIGR03803 family)
MRIKDGKFQEERGLSGQDGACFRESGASSQTLTGRGLAMLLAATGVWLFSLGGYDAQAQPLTFFQSLYSFTNGADGELPYANLILSGTTLYGTTTDGGTNGSGTVFALNADGTDFRVLHTFSEMSQQAFYGATNFDGAEPYGGLLLVNKTLYGTTTRAGTGAGTIFAVNTNGTVFTKVYDCDRNFDGGSYAGLILDGDSLYGTSPDPSRSVFAVDTNGAGLTFVYFVGGAPEAGLLLSGNTLYGTASSGEYSYYGTVFALIPEGSHFTVLHSFTNSPDGANPTCSLVLSGNMLYGTASGGGVNGYGTVFRVTSTGTDFTVLHAFNGLDGSEPSASLVLSGQTLYGTTAWGGPYGGGNVFAVNTNGTGFTILHNFAGPDGADPFCSLVLAGTTLYGTTFNGGSNGAGTVFAITFPPAPVIKKNSMAVAGGQLQFVVGDLTPGATVYIQATSDLSSAGTWVPIATNVTTATTLTISSLSVTNANCGFFRVLEAFPP